tara:strand:- start:811 stop:1050 length:240 start_codon:yes stop_codon:yes gene_type:complete
MPPMRKKKPAMRRRCRRPRWWERRAGKRAPRKAPRLRRATMLPDVEASFLGVVERWKSVLKLGYVSFLYALLALGLLGK